VIKVKKLFSFLIISFFIISNISFAQSSSNDVPVSSSSGSGGGSSEGRDSFNPMEGIEMKPGSVNSGPNEDQLRAMAKEKMGKDFTEEKFQQMMKNRGEMSKNQDERAHNQEDFLYQQKGFGNSYDAGPSYEGLSKEQMLFYMVFENIGNDIAPREIKDKCGELDKIADIVISKLKAKVGDIQSLCQKIEAHESNCNDNSKKMCGMIGAPQAASNPNEIEKMQSMAFACPVNKDSIVQACITRSRNHLNKQMEDMEASCEKKASSDSERMKQECERQKQYQVCDKDKYVSQCLSNTGARKDDFDDSGKRKVVCPKYPTPACGEGTKLETKRDSNGCESYTCISTAPSNPCPVQTALACKDSESIQKKLDERGCVYYYCQASATQVTASPCPEAVQPSCPSNFHIEKKLDDKGCVSYYCASNPCQTPSTPSCPSNSKIESKTDSNGCVSYECVTVTTSSNSSSVTGAAVLNTYDDYLKHCESNWVQQERICKTMQSNCDNTNSAERCREQSEKNLEKIRPKIEENCNSQTQSFILAAEDKCSRIDKEKTKCFEENSKKCSQMKGLSETCRSTLTEDNLRKFIIAEAGKRCRFSGKLEDNDNITKSDKVDIVLAVLNKATQSDFDKLKLFVNDLKEDLKLQDTTVYKGTIAPNNFGDVKLLPFVVNAKLSTFESSEQAKDVKAKIVAGQKAEDAAAKLISLRDSDVPSQYLYVIEDKASDVLNVSDKLKDVEKKDGEKGVGYKMKLFLGFAKKAEQEEIRQLQDSRKKLNGSIDALAKLSDEVPSDVAKSILKEQVENLKKQQKDMDVLIAAKEKKSKGWFGLFG